MPETPKPTRYQMGSWTVTMLKQELRNRNMSPVGNKQQLIDRLEKAETEGPGSVTPKSARGRPPKNQTQSPATPSKSPTRVGISPAVEKLSVNELKNELRTRGLSPSGNKSALQKRLEEYQTLMDPFNETNQRTLASSPASTTSTPKRKTPMKGKGTPSRGAKAASMTESQIGLFRSPLTTLGLLGRLIVSLAKNTVNVISMSHICVVSVLLAAIAASTLQGPHQVYLAPFRDSFIWHFEWFFLGILSSIGLGTGAHTFLLFLGPFVARVTKAAYLCETLEFPLRGEMSFICEGLSRDPTKVNFSGILLKVLSASIAWGIGTAVGEFPPFLLARASALSGKMSGSIQEVEQLQKKPRSERTYGESLQLFSFKMVKSLGFLGIMLAASIPNPLFDFTGMTCGYFLVPFFTFATATIIGKGFIKAIMQTSFVIFLFSGDLLEEALNWLQSKTPLLRPETHQWLLAQRSVFQERRPDETFNLISNAWHWIITITMVFFVLSAIRNVAIVQARKEGLISA